MQYLVGFDGVSVGKVCIHHVLFLHYYLALATLLGFVEEGVVDTDFDFHLFHVLVVPENCVVMVVKWTLYELHHLYFVFPNVKGTAIGMLEIRILEILRGQCFVGYLMVTGT